MMRMIVLLLSKASVVSIVLVQSQTFHMYPSISLRKYFPPKQRSDYHRAPWNAKFWGLSYWASLSRSQSYLISKSCSTLASFDCHIPQSMPTVHLLTECLQITGEIKLCWIFRILWLLSFGCSYILFPLSSIWRLQVKLPRNLVIFIQNSPSFLKLFLANWAFFSRKH